MALSSFEDAKIALIEGIVTGLVEKRPALNKAAAAVKDVFRRIDWLKVAKRAGGLALTAFTGIPTPDQIGAIVGSLEAVMADPAKLATKENLSTAIDEVKAVLKPGETKNVPEEVEAFRMAFDQLLKDAGIKQLIVLIDDLDRCLPDTAIETLEAIRLFVFTARTAFVVAADEAMIEYAVRKHFPDLPDSTGPRDYARNYLEKLIQVPFRIPALGETETRIYVTLLLAGAEIGENDADYANLIGVAREKLKRPWTSGGLDAATVKTALSKQAEKANNALASVTRLAPSWRAVRRATRVRSNASSTRCCCVSVLRPRADSGTISNCPCSRSSCSLSASSRGCSSRSRLSPRSTRRGYARTSKHLKRGWRRPTVRNRRAASGRDREPASQGPRLTTPC